MDSLSSNLFCDTTPVGSVVKAIYVDDGQRVLKGDRLIELDPTLAKSQLASLQKIRTSLLQENQFYTAAMRGTADTPGIEAASVKLLLPPQLVSLTKSRVAIVAENQLYRAQISGAAPGRQLATTRSDSPPLAQKSSAN